MLTLKAFLLFQSLFILNFTSEIICLDKDQKPIRTPSLVYNCVYNTFIKNDHLPPSPSSNICITNELSCFGCCYHRGCQKIKFCKSIIQRQFNIKILFLLIVSFGLGVFMCLIVTYTSFFNDLKKKLEIMRGLDEGEGKLLIDIRQEYTFSYLQENASQLTIQSINQKIKEMNQRGKRRSSLV